MHRHALCGPPHFGAPTEFVHITISDHALVTVTLALPVGSHRAWTWPLNENLLDDPVVETKISDALKNYFRENTAEDLSEGMIWECHKAVIWGELIALGTKLIREQQADYHRVFSCTSASGTQRQNWGRPQGPMGTNRA